MNMFKQPICLLINAYNFPAGFVAGEDVAVDAKVAGALDVVFSVVEEEALVWVKAIGVEDVLVNIVVWFNHFNFA
jgi:hypothetical protein